MLKKLPLAAAIAICAAFPTAAYASGIGSAVGGAVSAGGEIMNDAFDAGRDILNGFTARDTEGDGDLDNNAPGTDNTGDTDPGDNTAGGNDPDDTGPGGDNDPAGDAAGSDTVTDDTTTSDTETDDTLTSDTSSDDTTSSEDTVSGENDSMANSPNNPSTGVSTLGYTAVAAVLAAMGVMTTAVRRRDD